MQTRRWTNQGLPQTLQIAVFLLYIGAAFTALLGNTTGLGFALAPDNFDASRLIENLSRAFVVIGGAYGAYLIANERKLGYTLGVAAAAIPLVAIVLICVRQQITPLNPYFDLVGLLFDIALFALLVHPQSRSYVRLWFK